MSYTFELGEPAQPGDTIEFYSGFPASASELAGEADPISTTTINASHQATLTSAAGNSNVAIVVRRAGKVWARSNGLDLDQFSQREPNKLYVLSQTQTLDESTLRTYVPATPFTEDNITITSANLSVSGSTIKLKGSAKSDGWWFFDFTLDYEYTFSINRVTTPLWVIDGSEAYLTIEKESFELDGKNILQDILLVFAKGAIRTKLEQRLESELNTAVRSQLALVPDYAGTIADVDIGGGKVVLQANLIGTESLCLFSSASSGTDQRRARMRPEVDIRSMHGIRDQVLRASPKGRIYLSQLAEHQLEIKRLFKQHPSVQAKFAEAVDTFLAANVGRKSHDAKIPERSVELGEQILGELEGKTSRELAETIGYLKKDLATATDKKVVDFVGSREDINRGETATKRPDKKSSETPRTTKKRTGKKKR